MKPVDGSEPTDEPGLRFTVLSARLAGGYGALAKRLATAAIPTALAFTCPFIWAFVVYQILRSAEVNQRTFKELTNGLPGYLFVHDRVIEIASAGMDVVSRDDVIDGWIEQAGAQSYVHVRLTRARRLLVQPSAPADAEAILEALGVSQAQQTARFAIASTAVARGEGAVYHLLGPWIGIPALFAAVAAAVSLMVTGGGGGVLLGLVILGTAALFSAGFVSSVRRGAVIVGRDGVTVRRGREERFVGYDGMRGVRLRDAAARGPFSRRDALVVDLEGESLELECGSFAADDPDMLSAMHQRIASSLLAYREMATTQDGGLTLLERRGRPVSEWRDALRILVEDGSDYRAARLNPVHLAETVEDATADVERRLGAAIALSSQGQRPELLRRVRIAARACANPKLRVLLERACEGELEVAEIEAALAEESELRA